MPEFIDIDVSEMTDGSEITMGDIKLPAGVKLLSKKDEIVAKVVKAEAGPEAEASQRLLPQVRRKRRKQKKLRELIPKKRGMPEYRRHPPF